jgi:arsenate reductase (glutaredoxin)
VIELYGIPNCDQVRAARRWLDARAIACRFHDYKREGAQPARLSAWSRAVCWEALLNRRGTTFRALPAAEREGLDEARALALMAAQPSLIRRPVAEHPGGLLVGFDEDRWLEVLG